MSKVYVVTAGCYSDYSIIGIFSTLEKANTYIELSNKNTMYGNDFNDPIEYYLDTLGPDGKLAFYVAYRPKLKPVTNQWSIDEERDYQLGFGVVSKTRDYHSKPIYEIRLLAKSKEAALKIANEKIMQFIAMGEVNE